MNRNKRILILPLVFVLASIASFFIQKPFARMTRYFYTAFTHNKIYFTGKYFRLFPGDAFILSFGIFCVVLTALLFRYTFKQGLYRILMVVGLFFLSVTIVCWVNSTAWLATCTACKSGRRPMGVGQVKYDIIFITGLSIALLPAMTAEVVKWCKKKPRTRDFNERQLI